MTVQVRTAGGVEERPGLSYLAAGDVFRIQEGTAFGRWRVALSDPERREDGERMVWAVQSAPFIEGGG